MHIPLHTAGHTYLMHTLCAEDTDDEGYASKHTSADKATFVHASYSPYEIAKACRCLHGT